MVTLSIADETKTLQEVSPEWINRTINRNRVMEVRNCVVVEIDSENITLRLSYNCGEQREIKPSNAIESRIVFLWKDLMEDGNDLDPQVLYECLQRMAEWVSYEPKKE